MYGMRTDILRLSSNGGASIGNNKTAKTLLSPLRALRYFTFHICHRSTGI